MNIIHKIAHKKPPNQQLQTREVITQHVKNKTQSNTPKIQGRNHTGEETNLNSKSKNQRETIQLQYNKHYGNHYKYKDKNTTRIMFSNYNSLIVLFHVHMFQTHSYQ